MEKTISLKDMTITEWYSNDNWNVKFTKRINNHIIIKVFRGTTYEECHLLDHHGTFLLHRFNKPAYIKCTNGKPDTKVFASYGNYYEMKLSRSLIRRNIKIILSDKLDEDLVSLCVSSCL